MNEFLKPPSLPKKRKPEEMAEDSLQPPQKTKHLHHTDDSGSTAREEEETHLLSEKDRLLKLMDQVDAPPLDSNGVRKLTMALGKAIEKNQEMRIRFAEDPARFADSEADLDASIHAMLQLAATPEFFSQLVEANTMGPLLTLLTHENADIVTDSIKLLQELTDEDVSPESGQRAAYEGMHQFIQGLIDHDLLVLLAQNLARFNDDGTNAEEATAVFSILAIVENVLSFNPTLASTVVEQKPLLHWLLQKIRKKGYDANKQYASEILAILTQTTSDPDVTVRVLRSLLEADGMEALLQSLSVFKKKDPKDADEQEMMENLFDTLCALLSHTDAKEAFVQLEGVELMMLMLKEKGVSRMRALKVLSFGMSGLSRIGTRAVVERFVDALGLKYLFSTFMKRYSKTTKKKYAKSYSEAEEDEHGMTIMSALFRHLTETPPLFRLQRLLHKFREDDFAKLDRLLEMHILYYDQLKSYEKQQTAEEETDQDEFYVARLGQGLFTLQLVDVVVGDLIAGCGLELEPDVRQQFLTRFQSKERSIHELTTVLKEYRDKMGADESDVGVTDREKLRITLMLENLKSYSVE